MQSCLLPQFMMRITPYTLHPQFKGSRRCYVLAYKRGSFIYKIEFNFSNVINHVFKLSCNYPLRAGTQRLHQAGVSLSK